MRGIDRSVIMADSAGLVSLARDLHQWGQHKVAEALFQQAATHVEQILGSDDPTLANILDAYTDFLVSLRRKQKQLPSENAQIKSGGEPGRPRSELLPGPQQNSREKL